MDIKNLSQLKKALASRHVFVVTDHRNFSERIGERRVVNKMQTNGAYTIIPNDPDHKISQANRGLGSWFEFGKAGDWEFADNGLCTQYLTFSRMGNIERLMLWQFRVTNEIA